MNQNLMLEFAVLLALVSFSFANAAAPRYHYAEFNISRNSSDYLSDASNLVMVYVNQSPGVFQTFCYHASSPPSVHCSFYSILRLNETETLDVTFKVYSNMNPNLVDGVRCDSSYDAEPAYCTGTREETILSENITPLLSYSAQVETGRNSGRAFLVALKNNGSSIMPVILPPPSDQFDLSGLFSLSLLCGFFIALAVIVMVWKAGARQKGKKRA